MNTPYNDVLTQSPVSYTLVTSKKEFNKLYKEMGFKKKHIPPWISSGADATTHFVSSSTGNGRAIVSIPLEPKYDEINLLPLLVHEAVHVWQEIRNSIGEKYPSIEFEAYSIQTITQNLLSQYMEALEK